MSSNESAGPVPGDAVRLALSRVLSSEQFSTSKRLQRFLSFIVEKVLDGSPDDIKEYNIALAVFDREPSFDSRTDTIVRVEARRLRQQLSAYYRAAGVGDELVIQLRPRGYIPEFVYREGAPTGAPAPPSPLPVGVALKPRLKWYSLAIAGMLAIVAGVAVASWRLVAGTRAPSTWEMDGAKLRILDSNDKLCWEKRIASVDPNWSTASGDRVVIEDIDGDGRREVLFNFIPDNLGDAGGSLRCYEQDGRPRWEHRYGASKILGDRAFDQTYVGRFVRPIQAGGKRYLLTIANHYLWYPAQVALLDPQTGQLVEEYWHPGSIYHGVVRDVDGDGHPDLLFAALNNPGPGLGHAAIGILKIPFSTTSPSRKTGQEPLTGGGEFAYRLFPQPDVNTVTGTLPIPPRMSIDQHGRILVQTPMPEGGGIVYYLDFALNVIECRFSDNFIALHERFFREHLLDHHLALGESESLGTVVAFPAAPDGNSAEINRLFSFAPRRPALPTQK